MPSAPWRWSRPWITTVPLAAGVTTIVGVLAAWILGVEGVKRIAPALPDMKANTAIALIGLGTAMLLLRAGQSRARRRTGRVVALLVALLGAAILLEYAFGSVGIDELLFDDRESSSGRSAPQAALVALLLGGTLATLERDHGPHDVGGWLLGAAAVVVLSALVGYALDVDFLRARVGTAGVALHTALALAAAIVGTAFLRPDRGVVGYLRGDDLGAATALRLLPAVVVLPLVMGFAHRGGLELGLASEVVTGLTVFATMGAVGALVFVACTRLTRSDGERGRAQAASGDALTRYRAMLEATPDPTLVVDADGRIAHANRRADESFGYAPGELEGLLVEQLLPERFRRVHLTHRATFAENPHSRPMGSGRELFARHKDGSELPVEISLSPVRDGGPPLVIASIRDVTERKRAEAGLREAAHFFEMSHDLLCTAGLDGRFQKLNSAWTTTLGWTADELISRPLLSFVHPDDVEDTVQEMEQLARGMDIVSFVNRWRTKDRGWRWLEWNATCLASEQSIYASARDITARMLAEEARRQAEVQFTQAFDEAPIGMALTDVDGSFISVNPALCELTGYSSEQLLATDMASLTHPEDVAEALKARRRMLAGESTRHHAELRLLSAGGEAIPVDAGVTLVSARDGKPSHFVSLLVDMSERKRFEGRLQHLAEHDPLTGLFNRRRFEAELERELAIAARYGNRGALLALDLDHFKYVNDSLGHAVGDELITRIGAAMKARLRTTDVLARLGGDEFAVVLPRVDEDEAVLVAGQILAAIREDGQVEGGHHISASIGITMFAGPTERVTAAELMIEADIAMYDAKEAGRDRVAVFEAATGRQDRVRARLTWADRIRFALANDAFVLHAQPILGLNGDSVPRYELLLRMIGEDGELIAPGDFLGVAERFDMIRQIDRWVVTEAIRLLAEQQLAGREVRFEMNLSAKSVTDPQLVDVVAEQLRASGADPRGLCFEITETAAIVNVDRAKLFARRLRELGCTFALDDFGAGFASFYYLKHLEFDYLKIDGEFIQGLADSPINQLVVKSLVRIADGLGKRTIAEFVTDDDTLQLVREYGVSYAQGFWIAKPGPITCDEPGEPSALPELLHVC